MTNITKSDLIRFEQKIKTLWQAGKIRTPWHACGGNEEQVIEYFKRVKPNDWIFSTWRNNYHWLLKTGDEKFLYNKIINENNSMHIIDIKRKFLSSSIVGGNCAIATGVAYAIKLKGGKGWVHIFCGDGCLDEGWFSEALRYSIAQNLNITFIVENNDRSVCTSIKDRWGKKDD